MLVASVNSVNVLFTYVGLQLRIVKVTRAGRDTVSIVGVDTH